MKVVTFYSYKGGVGRTMALANCVLEMADKYDYRLVAVDFDLEAPGLCHVPDLAGDEPGKGLMEYLLQIDPEQFPAEMPAAAIAEKLPPIEDVFLHQVSVQTGKLWFMPAGEHGDAYGPLFDEFRESGFLHKLKNVREFFSAFKLKLAERTLADYVFVDSRTGMSDPGWVCLSALPDIVVLLTSLNQQNVEGTRLVAKLIRQEDERRKEWGALPREIIYVASPVPISHEEELKEQRMGKVAEAFGVRRVPVVIPYHAILSLHEEAMTRRFPGSEPAKAYRDLIAAIVARNPDDPRHEPQEGLEAQKEGNPQERADLLEALLESLPDREDVQASLAGTLMALERWEEAEAHISVGLQHQPDNAARWFNRGLCRVNTERFEEAAEDYERAVEIKSDFHEAWNNWGNTLSALAQQTDDPGEAEKLYRGSFRKHERAVEINPDDNRYWNNWAVALGSLAERTEDRGEAEKLYRESFGKYERAVSIKPDFHEAYYNWGNLLGGLADRTDNPGEAEELYRESFGKYERAVEIKSDDHEAYNNWGTAVSKLADRSEDPGEAEKLYRVSFGKYERAVEIEPDKHEAWYNWGFGLSALAYQMEDPGEASELYRQSFGKYERAVDIRPDKHEAYGNWGNALLVYLRLHPERRDEILAEAEEVLLKGEAIKRDSCSYNLSCVYALRGDTDKAFEWLERGLASENADSAHVETDEDWDGLRDDPRYKEILDRYRK